MKHGIIDVFAFQEALLIEAVFGIAVLTMIWIGFRRWLQLKDRSDQRVAEREARYEARIEGVESRLKSLEKALPTPDSEIAQMEALPVEPIPHDRERD